MTFDRWVIFIITEAVLSLTPGPAVLFVVATGITKGPAKSVAASLGILSANAVYFALSATTIGAILVASYNLFFLIKWIGAAYLIYLGVQCFRSKGPMLLGLDQKAGRNSNRRVWLDAFFLQGANPKAILFFTAILPQFIDPNSSVGVQVLILGLSSIVVEFFILFGYGQLAGRTLATLKSPRFEKVTNRLAGTFLIGAGLGLARLKQT